VIRSWLEKLWELLCPSRAICCGCGDELGCSKPFLCDRCLEHLKISNVVTKRQEWEECGMDAAAFVYYYGGPVKGLVHSLKFRGVRILSGMMAKDMAELLRIRFDCGYDWIVPIPLHPARLYDRGYNQAQLLAEHISAECGIAMRTDIVRRVRKTKQQSKLSKEKRAGNLKGAFAVNVDVRGKSILLIDDVITTGSTACACAEALKAAGAKEVRALAFAGTHRCCRLKKQEYRQKKA